MTLISQSAGIILVNVALQVTLLTGLLLLILRFLRGKAAWRYQLAFSGMVAVLVLAIVSAWMQSRQFNLFSVQLPVHSIAVLDNSAAIDAATAAESTDPGFEAVPDPRASIDQLLSGMLTLFYSPGDQTHQDLQETNWLPLLLVVIWLSGALWILLRIAVSARSLLILIRNSVAPKQDQQQRLVHIAHEISSEEPVFLLSTVLHSPVHVGYLTPKIILPTGMLEECDDQKIRAVLLHELAHWQRRDNIANLLQQFIVAVFWFHPFICQLSRIASRSREELCDNYVLAQQDPINYCETLLWLSTRVNSVATYSHNHYSAAVAMYSDHWNLEQRIRELIDNKRETTMTLSKTCQTSLKIVLLGFTLLVASVSLLPGMNQVQAQDTADSQSTNDSATRAAPPTRDAETLSESVFTAITQIQELMAQPPGGDSANLIEAKSLLDDLYEAEFEDANSFEKATILNFYTNYHLMREDYVEALAAFEQILTIDGLRDDVELRTLRSLGQLYAAEERWQESLAAFAQWRELSDEEDSLVWRGLSYGNYQLDQWQEAREFWLQYLATQDASETSRDDYAYLNGLHFQLEDWQSALALTQDMIVRFNEQRDWDNLRVLYERLDDQNALADIDPELGSTLHVGASEPQIAFANVVPTDGDYIPLLASAPMYPRVAADERIEGWVLVEFTVGSDGQVDQGSVSVVDAEPAEVFNASSLRAAREFVFAPRMVAGEPVPVPGVQYLFRFRLGEDDA